MLQQLLISPPSPFAPKAELQAFLDRWKKDPRRDLPEVMAAVAQVKRALDAEPIKAPSSKAP